MHLDIKAMNEKSDFLGIKSRYTYYNYRIKEYFRQRKASKTLKEVLSDSSKHELRVLGLCRSGNHAIVNWIIAQCPGRVLFYNDLSVGVPFQKHPINLIKEAQNSESEIRWFIHSYEDVYIKESLGNKALREKLDSSVGKSAARHQILILRNPWNLIASRLVWKLKKGAEFRENLEHRKRVVGIWKEHAKEYLNDTCELKNKVVISFDHWCSDSAYRQGIATSLGIPFTDKGFDSVASEGGGSSFNGLTSNTKERQVAVLQRWKSVEDDPIFKSLTRDQELVELSERIYGRVF